MTCRISLSINQLLQSTSSTNSPCSLRASALRAFILSFCFLSPSFLPPPYRRFSSWFSPLRFAATECRAHNANQAPASAPHAHPSPLRPDQVPPHFGSTTPRPSAIPARPTTAPADRTPRPSASAPVPDPSALPRKLWPARRRVPRAASNRAAPSPNRISDYPSPSPSAPAARAEPSPYIPAVGLALLGGCTSGTPSSTQSRSSHPQIPDRASAPH